MRILFVFFSMFLLMFHATAAETVYFPEIRAKLRKIKPKSDEDYRLGDELLREMRKLAESRKRALPRTYLIMETVYFRSGRLWYTEKHWRDRQLHANRRFWEPGTFSQSSFAAELHQMQLAGVDAVNYFIDKGSLRRIFDAAAAEKMENFKVIPTVFGNTYTPTGLKQWRPSEKLMKSVLNDPYAFCIQNRPVVLGYSSDRCTPETIRALKQKFDEVSGRKTAFIPDIDGNGVQYWPEIDFSARGQVRASGMIRFFDHLRKHLSVSDGVEYGYYLGDQQRNLHYDYYDKVLLPLFGAACASEPCNGKKIFALKLVQGYTNMNGSQNLDSDGTKTLRGFLKLAEKHRIDIICGFEWDELNENTNMGPTVAKPMANTRILRYWMNNVKGIPQSPLPGDDVTLPNMIVSSNRQLCCGQEYELELLHVPDGSADDYSVVAELIDNNGKTVYKSKELRFPAKQFADQTIRIPTEKLPASIAVQPRLRIKYRGKTQLVTGLPPTVIRGTVSTDYTWFSTPLRNLLIPEKAQVVFTEKGAIRPGARRTDAAVDLKFSEPLNAVEIVQNSQEIFCHDPLNEFRQNSTDMQLFRISFRVIHPSIKIRSTLTCPGAVFFRNRRMDRTAETISSVITGTSYEGHNCHDVWFALPKNKLERAVLSVQGTRLSGPWKGKEIKHQFPLAPVLKNGVTSAVFPDTFMLAVEASPKPCRLPLALNRKDAKFTAALTADQPDGMLAVRAISLSGKVWWSSPHTQSASGKMVPVQAYSDLRGCLRFQLPSSRVPDFSYDFQQPQSGYIIPSPYGREFYAHAGGFLSIARGFEGLIHGFTVPVKYTFSGPPPQWVVQKDGKRALAFDGKTSQGLFLPNTLVPQRSGFTLTFDLTPNDTKTRQIIFEQIGASSYLNGFSIAVENGLLELQFRSYNPYAKKDLFRETKKMTGLHLVSGKRQKLTLQFDGKNAVVKIDGQQETLRMPGIPYWFTISAFGGRDKARFSGLLHGIAVRHSADKK